uniref:Uncharacterized protein n=1 Tax=Erpetoichthys calabaricus TaxID=27687 RepID=A0A8C4RSI8_ERPCA
MFGSAVPLPGPPGPPGQPGPPGIGTANAVITYRNLEGLLRDSYRTAEGTLIYITDKSELYIRVRQGWRKVQLGDLIPITGDSPPLPGSPVLVRDIYLHLVALNAPLSGDMMGIRGADNQCFQQARAMGLVSTYRAFLSSQLQDLATIVKKADRFNTPIVNLKGEILFNNWIEIFANNGQFNPQIPIYSFDGRNVLTDPSWPQKMIWHGSSPGGIRLMSSYCEAWRAGDMAVTGQASFLPRVK